MLIKTRTIVSVVLVVLGAGALFGSVHAAVVAPQYVKLYTTFIQTEPNYSFSSSHRVSACGGDCVWSIAGTLEVEGVLEGNCYNPSSGGSSVACSVPAVEARACISAPDPDFTIVQVRAATFHGHSPPPPVTEYRYCIGEGDGEGGDGLAD